RDPRPEGAGHVVRPVRPAHRARPGRHRDVRAWRARAPAARHGDQPARRPRGGPQLPRDPGQHPPRRGGSARRRVHRPEPAAAPLDPTARSRTSRADAPLPGDVVTTLHHVTWTTKTPFLSGPTSVTEGVPGRWDVALAGRGYMLDLASGEF